jgi:hypothetical protein
MKQAIKWKKRILQTATFRELKIHASSGRKISVGEPSDRMLWRWLWVWVRHMYCDVRWLWLGNKCKCRHKLIPAQFGKVIWILAMNLRTPRWKPLTWLHISSSLFIHYSDSPPLNIRASTNNKPQFHLGRTECPVVSSLRRTISRMGDRKISVTERYFKIYS